MRNKTIVSMLMLILVISATITCKSSKILPDLTADQINAETAWTRITQETNYKKYPMWPSHDGVQPGQSPHGRFHKIFINDKLHDALPIADKTAPIGSIIFKENYTPDKEIAIYTAMIKVADYDPDNGNWFWAKYAADGTVEMSGKLQKCSDCHIGNNDYLMIHELDAQL